MVVFRVVAVGLVLASLLVYLRQHRGDLALAASVGVVFILFYLIRGDLAVVVANLGDLTNRAGLDDIYLSTMLKVIGVSYLVGFSAQACRDAKETVVGEHLEFAGKVLILFIAVPVMLAVLESILDLVP